MGDRWLLHKFEIAAKEVIEYKKHIVRAIHQDRAKADIMARLSREEVLLIFDYAMKFLPQKFREAQTDFFAKKGLLYTPLILSVMISSEGLSWHIMVCLWKTETGEINLKTMVYLMGNIKQVFFNGFSM